MRQCLTIKSNIMEEWRDIQGYEGLYQISSNAEVRKIMPNGEYKILKSSIGGSGYPKVSLRKNKISKTMLLHRLLALAFIPNPNNDPCINHKDENPLNCSLSNLEWCTYKYNSNYGTNKQRIKESLEKEVYQYTTNGVLVKRHNGMTEASRDIGVAQSAIVYATDKYDSKGVLRSIKGYIWRSKPWDEPNDTTRVTTTVIGLGWLNFKYVANTHKLDWDKIEVEQLNPKTIGMRSDTNLKRITMPKFYLNYFGKQWREAFKLKEE